MRASRRVENRWSPRKLSEITDGVRGSTDTTYATKASPGVRSRRSSLKSESCLPDRLVDTCTRVLPRPFQLNAIYMSVKSVVASVGGLCTRASSKERRIAGATCVRACSSPRSLDLSPLTTLATLPILLSMFLSLYCFLLSIDQLERSPSVFSRFV